MTNTLQPIIEIPEFKSREDEAKFWDTHDVADLLEQGERVQVEFVPKKRLLSVRFDDASVAQLRLQAHKHGLQPTTLIRMWVLEKLSQLSARHESLKRSW